ncbi:GNAT family N-acetyltransferase [Salinisphaera hydrothermalis]|uniref:GCN5-related N-acetyltransferase n=1 Tax=Salinisphaera hydrothermalis (strain C41B8) TaxID=1304275 RepID=A0A084IJW6_SALHC|nr:GNAT family protein [Salinisphaera hydrothermalis]KEZ77000.1 GCN5-related N-acetyltransferase [Salinisphaera hydrothermalis C41B8]
MFTIEPIQPRHEVAFLDAARRSAKLHHPWISPPRTVAGFRQHLRRYEASNQASYVAVADDGPLIGCVHLNEIVHGALESAYLAYFAFEPYQGRGLMSQMLAGVVDLAFDRHGLHRVEANVQPSNHASKALVERLGFRLEGFSPRYLKIGGHWRDHDRYALTVEEWTGRWPR